VFLILGAGAVLLLGGLLSYGMAMALIIQVMTGLT
jgi:hypothetical protein